VKVEGPTGSFRPSPDGSKLLFEARGELLEVPVDEKVPFRDLTESSGSREKDAVYSPDGTRIALISDRGGEEQLWVMDAGGGDERQLTDDRRGFRYRPTWSPDGRWIAFADKSLRLSLVDVESAEVREVVRGEFDDAWERWGIQEYRFSPDSRWLVYTEVEASLNDSIFLYELATGRTVRVTGPETRDWSPDFSPDGRFLYFLSDRTLAPIMGRMDQNHVFLNMTRPYVVLLSEDQPSPFDVTDPEDDDAEREANDPITIDVEGLRDRVLAVEGIEAGDYDRLETLDGGFAYLVRSNVPFLKYQAVHDATAESLDLWTYDLQDQSAALFMAGVNNYHLTHDKGFLAYKSGATVGVVETGAPAEVGDGKVDVTRAKIRVDRLAEFEQIFNEAWRVQRDWFYDPGMHGVDWAAIRQKYGRFVRHCGNRADLNYLIGEMIGELNAGHTYVFGGDTSSGGPSVSVGTLGADLEVAEGDAHPRIVRILPGNAWHPDERSPLREPGCGIREGDFLLSIDDRPIRAEDNVFSFLEDAVGRQVEVTAGPDPSGEGAVTCRIRPAAGERSLRYRAWVDGRRSVVEKATNGRLGYLHIPDMMDNGLVQFARGWYHDFRKEGFIIDDRYNSGGFVGDMIIDRLERRVWSYTQPREGGPIPNPERTTRAHIAVLVNADTGSNGEYFAEAIRIRGLAPLIGERTWGGAVGIEPHQGLVDGGLTTPPQFAPYGLDRRWLIEGHGVEPDIEVENLPLDVLSGHDAQLDRAIAWLMSKIAEEPRPIPDPPEYPDKSKPVE